MTALKRPEPPKTSPSAAMPDGLDWQHLPPHVPRVLRSLAAARDGAEVEIVARFESHTQAAENAFHEESAAIEAQHATRLEQIESQAAETKRTVAAALEAATAQTQGEHKQARQALLANAKQKTETARALSEQTRWEATALFEASTQGENRRREQFLHAIAEEQTLLEDLQMHAAGALKKYRWIHKSTHLEFNLPAESPTDPLEAWRGALQAADESLAAILKLKSPKAVSGLNIVWLVLVPGLLLVWPAIHFLGVSNGLIAATVGALLIAGGLGFLFYSVARKALAARVHALDGHLKHADWLSGQTKTWVDQSHAQQRSEIGARRTDQIARADLALTSSKDEVERMRSEGLARIDAEAAGRQAEADARAQAAREASESARAAARAELERWHRGELKRVADERKTRLDEAYARRDRDWNAMKTRWLGGVQKVRDAVEMVRRESAARFLDWSDEKAVWHAPAEVPPAIQFGRVSIDLARVPHGLPRDAELCKQTPGAFELPALLTFPDRASLLLRARGGGKEAGIPILQAAMLRYATSLPPGKVRFTIIDPVGLGRNFAAFMHLADYSELSVTSRIWTEPPQIEQRLADLSLHMENVIQQFLRNEFANLEAYNRQAAEVAEPYRVLVIANFPANFTDTAAQRLLSIMQGGARCGVHTLILVDEDQAIPSSLSVDDLQSHATTLNWDGEKYIWRDPDFAAFALSPDRPPPDERLSPLLHQVGAATRAAARVEVPFEVIAPPADRWWTGSTRQGVDVPLGRAGATKLQPLALGKGTSQHALIAGRTGSGKSTLLHALITNAALIYSPEEVEFYLIDFKKGVEFRTYAEHQLPHARVIAIESEREFGLSVLQRLDEELKRRGEAFRAAGVQDLAGYRGAGGAAPIPRTLLIVDEFQEFFVDDDKLAQDAALLLDRLVRQGRAFGIHVLLGSQTLGGAYSLARTTLGQMAVRIALQCSEADAHLILSEDNAAARLLSRPGEAIYNDANGLVEGNHVFQVVWLSEPRREEYLKRVGALARERDSTAPRSQIVFEGNVPSDLAKNTRLSALIRAGAWGATAKAPIVWLGEAVAIKDPTSFVFRRQGGNNLLVIGQDAAAARGVFAAALLSMAAQLAPGTVKFHLLDGTTEDDADFGLFAKIAGGMPHAVQIGAPRDTAGVLGEISADLKARQEGLAGAPATFLFLFDGSRFRDLRKADDDFGFSRGGDEKATPSQLGEILREGPALGIHVIAWFDTLNNLQRVFDRTALREFEYRVLFQMSANDSSTLVDSPLANRLGAHRALASSEDQGTLEKFRPYAVPEPAWLRQASDQLSRRIESKKDDVG